MPAVALGTQGPPGRVVTADRTFDQRAPTEGLPGCTPTASKAGSHATASSLKVGALFAVACRATMVVSRGTHAGWHSAAKCLRELVGPAILQQGGMHSMAALVALTMTFLV